MGLGNHIWGDQPVVRNENAPKNGLISEIFDCLRLISEKDLFDIVVAQKLALDKQEF
jgi:hypothetical protein